MINDANHINTTDECVPTLTHDTHLCGAHKFSQEYVAVSELQMILVFGTSTTVILSDLLVAMTIFFMPSGGFKAIIVITRNTHHVCHWHHMNAKMIHLFG